METDAKKVSSSCVVCWTEAELPISTNCDHTYCSECLEQLCLRGHTGNECSIPCCAEGCQHILQLDELESILPEKNFNQIVRILCQTYLIRNPGHLLPCPTDGCGGCYQATRNTTVHKCENCERSVCTTCQIQIPGNTACPRCARYNLEAAQAQMMEVRQLPEWEPVSQRTCPTENCSGIFFTNTEEKVEACQQCQRKICTTCYNQLTDNNLFCISCALNLPEELERLKANKGFKNCPKCGVLVQKIEGCEHMICLCGAHFCWLCSKEFSQARDVYEHIAANHQALGLYEDGAYMIQNGIPIADLLRDGIRPEALQGVLNELNAAHQAENENGLDLVEVFARHGIIPPAELPMWHIDATLEQRQVLRMRLRLLLNVIQIANRQRLLNDGVPETEATQETLQQEDRVLRGLRRDYLEILGYPEIQVLPRQPHQHIPLVPDMDRNNEQETDMLAESVTTSFGKPERPTIKVPTPQQPTTLNPEAPNIATVQGHANGLGRFALPPNINPVNQAQPTGSVLANTALEDFITQDNNPMDRLRWRNFIARMRIGDFVPDQMPIDGNEDF